MNSNKYKLVFYGKNIYKECVLDPAFKSIVKAGTNKNCSIRFNKEMFFCDFEITFTFTGSEWSISVDENLYISKDGIMKLSSLRMTLGESLTLKYSSSNTNVFSIDFSMDFDEIKRNYNRVINVSQISQIKIGASDDCDIFISDRALEHDSMILRRDSNNMYLYNTAPRYGIYVNGKKIDNSCRINNYDFFMIYSYSFFMKNGYLYTDTSDNIHIRNLESRELKLQTSAFQYPKFNRNTRNKYIVPTDEIEVLPPKSMPAKGKDNLALLLGPPIGMLALTIILRGVMSSGGSFVIYSAAAMSVSIIASIGGYISKKKEYKKLIDDRYEKYMSYIQKKEQEIIEKRKEEFGILRKIYRSTDRIIESVVNFDHCLFDRTSDDEDFLDVRIGTGAALASRNIKIKPLEFDDGEDELVYLPGLLSNKYKQILNAPIISHFGSSNAIGIVGVKKNIYEFLKNISLDIAIRHFYDDVKMVYVFSREDAERFSWVRWLKHTGNNDLGIRNIVCDEESGNIIFDYLYSILSQRQEMIHSSSDKSRFTPEYIVLVLDGHELKKHPVSKYITSAQKLGFTFVFMEEHNELLPQGCTEIIELNPSEKKGVIYPSENRLESQIFEFEPISDALAEDLALKLSPVYIDEVNLESDLTKNITLFELFDIFAAEDLDITERWNNARIDKSMAAPIGVKRKNEIVYLDLHEKFHGPHGLVAGTTGSGKSELLQTYILSMATLFHPYEVSFVIIDFKGGGMVNQFEKLPHLNGSITNIDGREIDRSLKSIRAELRKRQELFSEYKVNHINDYIRLYKQGKTSIPLPHLILIVDEFAELKMEQPEFMKELISTARIGRSLGVHLILATQKPSGVVDAQIWSNSKFKLCLKVQTKEDSQEVLKTPLAAEIVEPGRAYLQVGNNEQFDLLQSAYSGAKIIKDETGSKNTFEISQLNLWGKKEVVYSNKHANKTEGSQTQLEAIVDYISEYCISHKIPKLSGICLPPLKDIIYSDELSHSSMSAKDGIRVAIGVYDNPDQQKQEELVLDLSESNTYIIGSSQMGKTYLLQTIIKELACTYTPQETVVYIIDCGNMSLKIFEASDMIGGVALPSEDEKVTNLIKMLKDEITRRKNIFVQNLVGTHRAYIEAGFTDIPQIFLIIDNITAFREFYPSYDSDLLQLSRDGVSAGINIITTATQTNAISYKILSNFGIRMAFTCNDSSEYSNLFDRCRMAPKEIPGRGLYCLDKTMVEFQTALCVQGNSERERSEKLHNIITQQNLRYGGIKAKRIPVVPERITMSEMFANNKALYSRSYMIPVGISYDSIDYVYINLLEIGMFAVTGKDKSGKTNFTKSILSSINRTIFTNLTEAYIIDSSKKSFDSVKQYGFIKEYTIDANDADWIIDEITEKLTERKEYLEDNRGTLSLQEMLATYPLIMLVVDNNDFLVSVSQDKELFAKFNKLRKDFKDYKLCIIFSNIENSTVAYNAPALVKQIKENKQVMVFEDVSAFKFIESNIKQQRMYTKPVLPGDCYFCLNGNIEKVKTILDV